MPEKKLIEFLQKNEIMGFNEPNGKSRQKKISVPKTPTKLSLKRAERLARKTVRKRQSYNIYHQTECVSRRIYWPYLIVKIHTKKNRPIFGPRRIDYYVIIDAVAGGNEVASRIPDFIECKVELDTLVPFEKKTALLQQELSIAQKEKIPKLFIFGPPEQQVETVRLVYCPFWEVTFLTENQPAMEEIVLLSTFNGAIRTSERKCD